MVSYQTLNHVPGMLIIIKSLQHDRQLFRSFYVRFMTCFRKFMETGVVQILAKFFRSFFVCSVLLSTNEQYRTRHLMQGVTEIQFSHRPTQADNIRFFETHFTECRIRHKMKQHILMRMPNIIPYM